MKIPKRFKLYGQTIEVEISNDLQCQEDNFGEAIYRLGKLTLQSNGVRPILRQEHTFCHKLMHFILYYPEYHNIQFDEEFVERISHLLHQALITME